MRILGIDPGLRITGYACIEASNPVAPRIVEAGIFRLFRPGTKPPSIASRLQELDAERTLVRGHDLAVCKSGRSF